MSEERPDGCMCPFDGPHVVWSTDCPVHGKMAQYFAVKAGEQR